jgi:hypothetical protein
MKKKTNNENVVADTRNIAPLITDNKSGRAHDQADADIAADPDNIHVPNDDLDEGELSRLGEDTKDII